MALLDNGDGGCTCCFGGLVGGLVANSCIRLRLGSCHAALAAAGAAVGDVASCSALEAAAAFAAAAAGVPIGEPALLASSALILRAEPRLPESG